MRKKKTVDIVRRDTGEILVHGARWCSGWLCRLRGLQFRRRLKPGEALVLVEKKDSVVTSSIHMFFVFFPIAAVWVNSQGRVTHKQIARPWQPYCASQEPACYVIESSPELLELIQVGDELDFISE